MLLGCQGYWQAVEVYLIGRERFQAGVRPDGVIELQVAADAVLVGVDTFAVNVEQNDGRTETRRFTFFHPLERLDKQRQWKVLRCFAEIESEPAMGNKTAYEPRIYIGSLAPGADSINRAVRSRWTVENRLNWAIDVSFNDHQMRSRTEAAAHHLAVLKDITLNLMRLDPFNRKGAVKTRRTIAAAFDRYRTQLLGFK